MIAHPVQFQGIGRLTLEEGVQLGYRGAGHGRVPISLQPRNAGSQISLGRDAAIMNGCEFVASTSITVGARCMIGPGTAIFDADFHGLAPDSRREPGLTGSVVLEDNVWIGARVTVLKGVRIGQDAVVAAGSIVTKDVAAGAIVAGNPARIVGTVYPDHRE